MVYYNILYTVLDAKIVPQEVPFSKYLNFMYHIASWSHREDYGRRGFAVFFRKMTLNYFMSAAVLQYPFILQQAYFNSLLLWIISDKSTCHWCTLAGELKLKSGVFIYKGQLFWGTILSVSDPYTINIKHCKWRHFS